jgi:hypothetical protein
MFEHLATRCTRRCEQDGRDGVEAVAERMEY